MEEDKKIGENSPSDEDFKDFDDDEIEEDIEKNEQELKEKFEEKLEEEEEKNITPPDFEEDETTSLKTEDSVETLQEAPTADTDNHWEETTDADGVVKKYIVYIAEEFIPYVDKLSLDERSAYINEALEMKISAEDEKRRKDNKKALFIHLVVTVLVILLLTPVALYISHKAIMATFDNYKYSQDNFEKLYRHKFEKDRSYMRSLQYNKALEKKASQMAK